jgi:hypothetical protein
MPEKKHTYLVFANYSLRFKFKFSISTTEQKDKTEKKYNQVQNEKGNKTKGINLNSLFYRVVRSFKTYEL